MSIEDKIIEIAENVPKVYNAGYEKGKAEGGINYDAFWDAYQTTGDYQYAFCSNRFTDETYNPKYPIICGANGTTAHYMFFNNTKITSTKVPIDITNITTTNYLFGLYQPQENSKLETIVELIVDEENTFTNAFTLLSALKTIKITGTLGASVNLRWSTELTKESIEYIYDALSASASGKTCTLNKAAVNAAFTDEEWKALTDAKPNWTFTLYE
jgi:hypothetical protein